MFSIFVPRVRSTAEEEVCILPKQNLKFGATILNNSLMGLAKVTENRYGADCSKSNRGVQPTSKDQTCCMTSPGKN